MNVGARLEDGGELLLRQVNPAFVREGRPSSQVFRPTPKDAGLLSVNRGSMIDAASAYARFVSHANCRSCGVVAVSVAELAAEQLAAHDAPLVANVDDEDDPSHAVIDYRAVAKNAAEKKSGRLVRVALLRGFLFGPVEAPTPAAPSSAPPGDAPLPDAAIVGNGADD